jgi:hypothetical protein
MLLAWVLCLTLSPLPPFVKVAAAASAQAELAKVQDLAGRYAQAMKAIGQVAQMPLRNAQEIQTALGILRRYDADLGLWWYRMVQVAMSQPTFQQGVRERLRAYLASAPSVQAKARSAAQSSPGKEIRIPVGEEIQAFVKQIQANPGMIRTWPEASAAEQAIRQQLKTDAEVIRKVGANLKLASRGSRVVPGIDDVVAAFEGAIGQLLAAVGSVDLVPPAYALDPVTIGLLLLACVAVVVTTAAAVCFAVEWVRCVGGAGCTLCGIPPSEVSVPPPPPSPYDQCKAECVAWRENCIATARKAARDTGGPSNEQMCWYRYYDDCLWSSCERLRQQWETP